MSKVFCLVRSTNQEEATERLRQSSTARGIWNEQWIESSRLEVLCGDLDQVRFGLSTEIWAKVSDEVNVILHNGAFVSFTGLKSAHREQCIDDTVSRFIGYIRTTN